MSMPDAPEPVSTQFHGERHEFLAVLGLAPPVSEEDVKQAYLLKARTAHPDQGGSAEDFKRLQEAFEQATEYARFKSGRMAWLSRWVEQYAEQEKLIEQVKSWGGTVDVNSSDPMNRSIGPDFAVVLDKLTGITLTGPQIDDPKIEQLVAQRRMLAGLRKLALLDSAVTEVGLLKVRELETLRHLDLSGTPVDPEALDVILPQLQLLETLTLDRTGVGWTTKMKLRVRFRSLTID
jgi:hypothetical protein